MNSTQLWFVFLVRKRDKEGGKEERERGERGKEGQKEGGKRENYIWPLEVNSFPVLINW